MPARRTPSPIIAPTDTTRLTAKALRRGVNFLNFLNFRAALALLVAAPVAAAPLSLAEFQRRPVPTGGERIAYGPAPAQFVELWRPAGKGRFPVVAMIHGGCWQTPFDRTLMNAAALDLTKRGLAVWNIEYRRVGEAGGGWPGTYADVAAAFDLLQGRAASLGLDTRRLVATGHSAGGHLALWAASRAAIPAGDPLHAARPTSVSAVVGLGALPNLKELRAQIEKPCGAGIVGKLLPANGGTAAVSPAHMASGGARATLVHGALDGIAPPLFGRDYVIRARDRRAPARLITVPDAGHFDLIAPGTPAWERAAQAIVDAAR